MSSLGDLYDYILPSNVLVPMEIPVDLTAGASMCVSSNHAAAIEATETTPRGAGLKGNPMFL